METKSSYKNALIESIKIGLLCFWLVIGETSAIIYFAIFPLLILESLYRLGIQYEAEQDRKFESHKISTCKCMRLNNTNKASSLENHSQRLENISSKAA